MLANYSAWYVDRWKDEVKDKIESENEELDKTENEINEDENKLSQKQELYD